ncbi:MAG: glycosyltransferase family protein [Ferruginibacter sp.]
MKILYAIQGTGNGHISRARDIIPLLQKKGELDILVSGTEAEVQLPYPVKYKFKGLSFVFGKSGGIDLLATYKKSNLRRLYNEIKSLNVDEYDIVINDFEPVSAWACKLQSKECIGLSHQAAVINKKSPKPKKKDIVGALVLKNYAPVTQQYGFHFEAYDKNIFSPVIRAQIREAHPTDKGHYTVYLPACSDKRIIKILGNINETQWQVFSKYATKSFNEKNVHICPVNNEAFIKSMVSSSGILCGAGFETPAEAMFLKKKLLVVPMSGQYEQQCNAAALQKLGITVVKKMKPKNIEKIKNWVTFSRNLSIEYPDVTGQVIDQVFLKYFKSKKASQEIKLGEAPHSLKKFRELNLGKIINQISGR